MLAIGADKGLNGIEPFPFLEPVLTGMDLLVSLGAAFLLGVHAPGWDVQNIIRASDQLSFLSKRRKEDQEEAAWEKEGSLLS